MNEKQQTAVQWLREQLATAQSVEVTEWLWTKAFEMERQQIIDAHYQGYRNFVDTTEISEQYYTDTYQTDL